MTDAGDNLLHRLYPLAWWQAAVLPRLTSKSGTGHSPAAVTAATIMSDPELCSRPFGELLPGLDRVPRGSPADFLETARARNIVRRETPNTWESLARHSADLVATWTSAGRKTIPEIVGGVLTAWAAHAPETDAPAPDATSSAMNHAEGGETRALAVPAPPDEYLALRDLARVAYRGGAATIGEAVALSKSADVGREAWELFSNMPLDAMLDAYGDIDEAWDQLLRFDNRERMILARRVFPVATKLTLDELGRALDVTRERVRQLEVRIRAQIDDRLAAGDSCAAIEHAAAKLRRSLGTIATDATMREALAAHVGDEMADADLRRAVLRALAGPYRFEDGFWQRDDPLASLKTGLLERADEPLTSDDIDALLASADVADTSRGAVSAVLPLRAFDERYLVWVGGLQDKACRILQLHGEPMSREELYEAMGPDDVNFRSMVNAIQSDDRFRRLGLNRYGLAAWGGEEYTTIADEIEQAIDRRGGRADLNEIVEELVELFGVSAQSVRSYAASRRFHRDGDGALVIAPAGALAAAVAHMPAELDRDLVACAGSWAVRVVVDRDVLRGSGRPTRSAIAQAAGVRPGDSRTIELANGSAAISWRATQPAFGSTRGLVEVLGCAAGDMLFVPLTDGESAYAVARSAVDAASGLRRVALEVGVIDADDRLDLIAVAVGLDPTASISDLRTRLRARRQDELARHLPHDEPSDDDALEELMGLGE